jgi:fructose-1,6-bisphosphatase/inositol monophosphatase family enzyme
VVYLDCYAGFTKQDAQVLTDTECGTLMGSVFGNGTVVQMMGSNGLHHALVANGSEGVAGAITTAIGGPWDVSPVLLVLEAGGAARAFAVDTKGKFVEKNPLQTASYHFLVTGHDQTMVDCLSNKLVYLRGMAS